MARACGLEKHVFISMRCGEWGSLREKKPDPVGKNAVWVDSSLPADKRTRGGQHSAFKQIRANTTVGQNSFWPRTIRDWNSLPPATTLAPSVAVFKSRLSD